MNHNKKIIVGSSKLNPLNHVISNQHTTAGIDPLLYAYDLNNSNLSDSYLSDSDLSDSDLNGSDLSDSDLKNYDLNDSDLSNINDMDLEDNDIYSVKNNNTSHIIIKSKYSSSIPLSSFSKNNTHTQSYKTKKKYPILYNSSSNIKFPKRSLIVSLPQFFQPEKTLNKNTNQNNYNLKNKNLDFDIEKVQSYKSTSYKKIYSLAELKKIAKNHGLKYNVKKEELVSIIINYYDKFCN